MQRLLVWVVRLVALPRAGDQAGLEYAAVLALAVAATPAAEPWQLDMKATQTLGQRNMAEVDELFPLTDY